MSFFLARCNERGYTLKEVRACIVSQDGDMVTVDETHPAYPRPRSPSFARDARGFMASTGGPGTELKRLLARIGIRAGVSCACNSRAAQMDAWGCDECERRLEQVVGWLEQEHRKRLAAGETILPWSRLAAVVVIRLAIRRARAIENAQQATGDA
jgi:hypothetical protein